MADKKSTSKSTDLEKMLKARGMSVQDLGSLVKELGLKLVSAGDGEKRVTRRSVQDAWKTPGKELTGDDHDAVKRLPEVIGSANLPAEPKALEETQVVEAMREILVLRRVEDVVKGRHTAIKVAIDNEMTLRTGDEFEKATIVVPEEGHKFERIRKQGSPSFDFDRLEEVLDEDTWKKVTKTTRSVDEEKLLKAMEKGLVTEEDLLAITNVPGPSKAFYVKPLKDGDEVS